ncbi:chaperone protein DnaJ-like isoform X2 [Bolinopsis microptera]|uniref:chaperone protein DnaJ-like isoform X2 n=1 Tax=Bolinopsis microptera TaxID=2820187 RepID=UPI00307AFDFD
MFLSRHVGRSAYKCIQSVTSSHGVVTSSPCLVTCSGERFNTIKRGGLSTRNLHTTNLQFQKDYYKVLGVDKKAASSDIKKSYYQLAKKHHPDVAKDKDSAEKFKEISEAYEVLGDETKRTEYDQFGSGARNPYAGGGGGGGNPFGGSNYSYNYQTKVRNKQQNWTKSKSSRKKKPHRTRKQRVSLEEFKRVKLKEWKKDWYRHENSKRRRKDFWVNPEDLFRQAFGGNFDFESIFGADPSGQGQQAQNQTRTRYQMNISFLESCNGTSRNVTLSYPVTCTRCQGRKGEPGSGLRNCHRCHGTGNVVSQVGWYHVQQECPTCNGEGQIITQKCKSCHGKGTSTVSEEAQINIPSGITDGTTVRYRTKGGTDIGIAVQVEQSPLFSRKDLDVISTVDVDMATAILGGIQTVTGLSGRIDVKIPADTQPGGSLRLVGKGISDKITYRGVGNHVLKINVTLPRNLSTQQKLLLRAFDGKLDNPNELIKSLGGSAYEESQYSASTSSNSESESSTSDETTDKKDDEIKENTTHETNSEKETEREESTSTEESAESKESEQEHKS